MSKKSAYFIVFFLCWNLSIPALTVSNKTISPVLTVEVTIMIKDTEQHGKPIKDAQVIVIDSFGNILATKSTNTKGEASMRITVPKDERFPMKNMGEATVINKRTCY
jgi:hypothetical protein